MLFSSLFLSWVNLTQVRIFLLPSLPNSILPYIFSLPFTNLSAIQSAKVRPINQELQNLFLVLTYEKVRVCACVCMRACVSVCICMCICACIVFVCVSQYMCVWTCVCMCMCMHIHTCIDQGSSTGIKCMSDNAACELWQLLVTCFYSNALPATLYIQIKDIIYYVFAI